MLLLVALSESSTPATLHQLTQRASCSASSASRILSTMLKHRIVAQDPLTRKYRLGSQLVVLANAQSATTDLRDVAAPYLKRLRAVTNETATLQALVNTSSVCLAREESTEQLRFTVSLGQSWPLAQLGATSRVMLAFLDEPRRSAVLAEVARLRDAQYANQVRVDLRAIATCGITRTRAERVSGSASLAAAVFESDGIVCGAISVSGPGERLTDSVMDRWQADVRTAAQSISQEFGFRGTYPAQRSRGRT
jgi:DNA-binding IclR family transcriptional regulator